MTNSPTYQSPTVARPFAQLEGDMKLRGAIRFSDNTSLGSADFLPRINVLETDVSGIKDTLIDGGNEIAGIRNIISSLIVEGYVPNAIPAPTNANFPTSGIFNLKNANWSNGSTVYLSNRDTTSPIHSGAYVVAVRVNNQYRPVWVDAANICDCFSR
jgi:hypothetical protein